MERTRPHPLKRFVHSPPGRFVVRHGVVLQAVAVVGVALVVRWLGLGQEPLHDELYNFLAARSWAEQGQLTILPGAEPYDRAGLFSYTVGLLLRVFGASLEVARLPALLSGALLAGLVTWWLGRSGLHVAGLVAGLCVALDPELVQHSQITRFYAPHNLLFLAGALGLASALEQQDRSRRRIAVGLAAVVAMGLAFHLQIITLIGLTGVGVYALIWPGSAIYQWIKRQVTERRLVFLGGAVFAAATVLIALLATGLGEWLAARATAVDLWALAVRDNPRFYYAWLHSYWAPFVVLFPILALLSWLRAPRITALCLAVFGVAFIVHSLVPWKANRYLSYALPFFFVIGAVGTVEGLHRLWGAFLPLVGEGVRQPKIRETVRLLVLALLVGSLAVGSRAFLSTAQLVQRNPELHFPLIGPRDGPISWSRALPSLTPYTEDAAVVISSSPLKTIFFLNRLDFQLSRTSLYDPAGYWRDEFWIDPRFGVPTIVSPEALARIRCERGEALVLSETIQFQNPRSVQPETAQFLRDHGDRIALPSEAGVEAFLLPRVPAEHCSDHPSASP